jgi:hypothetical protein
VRRRILVLSLLAVGTVVCATGCGRAHEAASTQPTTTEATLDPTSVLGPGAHTIYQGTGWAVVASGGKAVAARLVGDVWRPDRTGKVRVTILGPHGRTPKITQVAAGLKAPTALVESALWVDGAELLEKGGGSPTNGTIYGATTALKPGKHLAIAYARTATTGTAVAWTFTSR